MTNSEIVSWSLNVLLMLAAWGLKTMHASLKENQRGLRSDISAIKDDLVQTKLTYLQKNDFKEFKEELFSRLDKMEQHLTAK